MAINLETLVQPDPGEEPKANITEEKAREILKGKVDYVLERGKELSRHDGRSGFAEFCFFKLTDRPLTHIGSQGRRFTPALLLEREKVQDIFLKLAQEEYGMDPNFFEEKKHERDWTNTSYEVRNYPARNGLSFQRTVDYRADGKPTSVMWGAEWDPTIAKIDWDEVRARAKQHGIPERAL